jgi:hypothetical protein
MKSWNFAKHAAAVALLLSVAACGGGGDAPSSGGTGGTGISFGTITDFGSVITNNRRLDDSTASVTLDDNPGSGPNGGLKKGMVVKVSGTFTGNTGTASTIQFRDNVEGKVCGLATVDGITTMRVLGQDVLMDATTIIENGPIAVNDIVEVSGLPDDQERIRASFVEKKTLVTALVEVKGRIDTVVNPTSFTINNLIVNHAGAVIDNNLGGAPAVGQFVEVKGTDAGTTCNLPVAGTDSLTATRVELEVDGAGGIANDNYAEVEGFVTVALNASNLFSIGSQQVMVSGSTRYLPQDFGSGDIVVGAKLEAEGTMSGGVLNASKVSFRHNVKMESDVTNLSGVGQVLTFNLVGFPGITLTTNSATDFRDPVVGGDQMEVRGIEGPNNTVLVTRVRKRSSNSDAFLQGAVDSVAGSVVTVLGVAVDTASIAQFRDVNDVPIDRGTFLSRVQRGTLVKFRGTLSGATVTWNQEAELED